MLKSIFAAVIFFAISATTGGHGTNFQDNPGIRDCPTITVACPDNVFEENSDLHFSANILPNVKYHWSIGWVRGFPKGRIKSGQGTPSLVVSASGPARRGLTVTVKVTGLDSVFRIKPGAARIE
ncbi:MAG TPA: hypothetical protein DC054_01980 [Blastocatellia bacterium]|nr:hypothetical protein [Blastocatellia bacterium]